MAQSRIRGSRLAHPRVSPNATGYTYISRQEPYTFICHLEINNNLNSTHWSNYKVVVNWTHTNGQSSCQPLPVNYNADTHTRTVKPNGQTGHTTEVDAQWYCNKKIKKQQQDNSPRLKNIAITRSSLWLPCIAITTRQNQSGCKQDSQALSSNT